MGDLPVLHQCDIDTVFPGRWLNDQIIEYALQRFGDPSNPGQAEREKKHSVAVLVPPSTSQLFLHAPEVAAGIARDLHLDISAGPILFCLNNATDVTLPLSGTHWTALVVVTETHGATRKVRHLHYDSMRGRANDHIAERMSDTLRAVFGTRDAALEHVVSLNGRQENAHDCGVFLLAVAQAYTEGAREGQEAIDRLVDGIDQASAHALRRQLLESLVGDRPL